MEIENEKVEILLVETNPGDLKQFIEEFRKSSLPNNFRFTGTGEEALKMIHQIDVYNDMPQPDVVIFDIQTFNREEWEMLNQISRESNIRYIPVIILTDGINAEVQIDKYKDCPDLFIAKPDGLDGYRDIVKNVEEFWNKKK